MYLFGKLYYFMHFRHIRHSPSEPYLAGNSGAESLISASPPSIHLPRFEHGTTTPTKKSSNKPLSYLGNSKDSSHMTKDNFIKDAPVSYLGTPKDTPDYSSSPYSIPDKLPNNYMGYPFERKRPELDQLFTVS